MINNNQFSSQSTFFFFSRLSGGEYGPLPSSLDSLLGLVTAGLKEKKSVIENVV